MSDKNSSQFSPDELIRYDRHFILPDIGTEGQLKLKKAKVLVIGAGGLGSPLLMYLAAAGVGKIGIVDPDVVSISNLQRQVIYVTSDIGKRKVEIAANRVQAINPNIEVELYPVHLKASNAIEIFRQYDLVADGTDNFATRYLVNDATVLAGIPNVYASIFRFDGQVSVFNQLLSDGTRGPNYRDIYPMPPPPGEVPSCAEGGVLGVLPGIIGSLQANEVIKLITGAGETLSGRLFLLDALNMQTRTMKIRRDPLNPLTGDHPTQTQLIDYEEFCGLPRQSEKVPGISAKEFLEWRDQNKEFILIDVREPSENKMQNLGGVLIPLVNFAERLNEIPSDRNVLIHCKSGKRSEAAMRILMKAGYVRIFNLEGGIEAVMSLADKK